MISKQLADVYDPLGAHLDDPHPFYAQARRTGPVFWSSRLGTWVVTRFDDVDAVLKDAAVFSSANSVRPVRDLFPATFAAFGNAYPSKPNHINSDGQAHRRLRAPYAKRLTPAVVRALEPEVRNRADRLVEATSSPPWRRPRSRCPTTRRPNSSRQSAEASAPVSSPPPTPSPMPSGRCWPTPTSGSCCAGDRS